MTKIITIANQKGGVAKTTTVGAFASGLKSKGYNVLAIDLDPQGNLSSSLGAENIYSKTVYNLMKLEASPEEVIQHLDACDIIPANIILAGLEHELIQTGKEYRLEETLKPIMSNYDFIIIDTPPSLGILTTNAIMIADEVIIPTTAGIFAATGIEQLRMYIDSLTKYRRRPGQMTIPGILLTRYNNRTNISKEIKEFTDNMAKQFETKLFKTFIRFSVTVEEAQANNTDIHRYSNAKNISDDYNAFIDEYLEGNE